MLDAFCICCSAATRVGAMLEPLALKRMVRVRNVRPYRRMNEACVDMLGQCAVVKSPYPGFGGYFFVVSPNDDAPYCCHTLDV